VAGWFLQHAEPLLKVSIVPRGTAALGFAQYLPNENVLATEPQLMDGMCMTLGGRASEELIFGVVSTGAQNDLERVTRMAYARVAVYGMSQKVGLLSFPPEEGRFDKPYSQDMARMIDEEVRDLVAGAYQRTLALLRERRAEVEALAAALLEKEVLGLEQLRAILGERPGPKSALLRNIDRFLLGTSSLEAAPAAAAGAAAGADNSKPTDGGPPRTPDAE
jgi:AFG3 family protein